MPSVNEAQADAARELLRSSAVAAGKIGLSERFAIPPFSVLDTRQGYWQSRHRLWLALGIQSELGRGEGLTLGNSPEVTTENLNYYRNRSGSPSSPAINGNAEREGIAINGTGTGKGGSQWKGKTQEERDNDRSSPGEATRPAMDYSKGERGDGSGKPLRKGAVPTTGGAAYFSKKFQGANSGQTAVGTEGGLNNALRQARGFEGVPTIGDALDGTVLIDQYRAGAAAVYNSGGPGELNNKMRGAEGPPQGEYDYPVEQLQKASSTSIFDPVLCELTYRWFCPPQGRVLDPFAGGSVRGVVAAMLGREYTGIDLSGRQLEANREQWGIIGQQAEGAPAPTWISGDSTDVSMLASGEYDFIFSCPPYFDLEVYSEHPADVSNMTWPKFIEAYQTIIRNCVAMLKPNRFACFVVSDVRGPDGLYRMLPMATTVAFHKAGMKLYNDAILVNVAGSLPVRVPKQFDASRKLGRMHQNVLIFVKGDSRKATEAIGMVELSMANFADTFKFKRSRGRMPLV